jgi:hypothetical protein
MLSPPAANVAAQAENTLSGTILMSQNEAVAGI